MSSALLSNLSNITNTQINVLRTAINQFNPMAPPSLALLPSLNVHQERYGYETVMEAEGDEVYRLIAQQSVYSIYYCRVNGLVYQVITNLPTTSVHRVQRA
jgi:hypothetical protein